MRVLSYGFQPRRGTQDFYLWFTALIAQEKSRSNTRGGPGWTGLLPVNADDALRPAVLQRTSQLFFQLVKDPSSAEEQSLLICRRMKERVTGCVAQPVNNWWRTTKVARGA